MLTIADTLKSNSSQLNAVDLVEPKVYTIEGIDIHDRVEQPAEVWFNPPHLNVHKVAVPWRPCLTMRRLMFEIWGKNQNEYIGRLIELYNDKTVPFKSEQQGGSRVSAMSHLPGGVDSITVMLPAARGKKKPYTVRLIKTELLVYPQDSFNKNKDGFIKAILEKKATIDDIVGKARSKGFELSKEQIDEINSILVKKELIPLSDDLFNLKSEFYFSNGTCDVDKFKKDLAEDGFCLTKEQESSLMPIGENDEWRTMESAW